MKYKSGDIVTDYISLIKITGLEDNYYVYTRVAVDDTYFLYTGHEIAQDAKSFERNYPELVFEEKVIIEPLISLDVIANLCKCPTFELVNFGCKCGGV